MLTALAAPAPLTAAPILLVPELRPLLMPGQTPAYCLIGGCGRKHHAHGLCDTHNRRWLRTGRIDAATPIREAGLGRQPAQIGCNVEGCHDEHDALGWCKRHYTRWSTHGDLDIAPRPAPAPECAIGAYDPAIACTRAAAERGLCPRHYGHARFWRLIPGIPKCSRRGCPHGTVAKHLCRSHYTITWRASRRTRDVKNPAPASSPA